MRTLSCLGAASVALVVVPAHSFAVSPASSTQCARQLTRVTPRMVMSEAAPAAVPATPRQRAKKREIEFEFLQETPGGWIAGLQVKNFQALTHHRIVVGKEMVESLQRRGGKDVEIKTFFKYVIKYMMDKGMKLDNTEGMIDGGVFPVNYFTVSQLTYFHDDVEEKIAKLIAEAPEV